jgi:hypothetical protein
MKQLCTPFFILLLLLATTGVRAQYYYNDILSNGTSRTNFMQLKKAGVKTTTVTSYEPNGEATQGFNVKQEVSAGRNTVQTITQSAYSNPSLLTTVYDAQGWPVSATDSSDASVSHITYTYTNDAAHQLVSVSSYTTFPGENTNQYRENRSYTFANGKPASMVRIKNGKDTLQVNFIIEEHGWVGEERWQQRGKNIETYYYYYDANGQVTDVAHYNKAARRILPDYTFEYDGKGRITRMVTVINGTNQYRTWRYTYDSRGLKTEETVLNKYRQPEGKLMYTYQ